MFGIAHGQTAAFDVFAASDLVKVFEDGYNLPTPEERIDLFGIRNEVISGQVVIAAYDDVGGVTVEIGDLKHEKNGAIIGPEAISWNFVGSVPVQQNTDRARGESMVRPAPGRFPDYLSEERKTDLHRGKYQAVWLTVKIPETAEPGVYSGTVRVESDQGDRSLPLRLMVYPLTMSDRSSLLTTMWYSVEYFPEFHGIEEPYSEEFYAMLEHYAENIVEHRQNVFRIPLESISVRQSKKGRLTFDFSRFDRWADIFWDTERMELLETGFMATFGPDRWYSEEIVLKDFEVVEEESGKSIKVPGEKFLPKFLPAFERHLKDKDWLAKTVFHIADESSNYNVHSWREVSDYIHRLAPGLRRIDAIEATNFRNRLEVWVPKLNQLDSWWTTFKEAQRDGYELWYYQAMSTNGYPNRFIDSPLIETRIMRWLNYRYGVTGYLDYGFGHWNEDPYSMQWPPHYGIAAHYIVYPKRDGLINSIRWEQSRNGVSDYEYFCLLENKFRQLKDKNGETLAWLKPEQRGVEIASRVMRSMTDFTREPAALYSAKKQVISEILALDGQPPLIVQTEPLEGSRLAFGPAIVEVIGWTDSEAEVTVNGEKTRVSKDGVFRSGVFLHPEREHNIEITVVKEGVTKTIIRRFEVVYP
jgi:hypothetical protein